MIENLALSALKQLWRNNTPPPNSRPHDNNKPVALDLKSLTITGMVAWDATVEQYAFYHAEQIEAGQWMYTEANTDMAGYCQIRDILRQELGIHVTRGIEVLPIPELEALAMDERYGEATGRA